MQNKAGRVGQVVDELPSNCEPLSSNPSTKKKKKKKEDKGHRDTELGPPYWPASVGTGSRKKQGSKQNQFWFPPLKTAAGAVAA
jgi:hypothetical protein